METDLRISQDPPSQFHIQTNKIAWNLPPKNHKKQNESKII